MWSGSYTVLSPQRKMWYATDMTFGAESWLIGGVVVIVGIDLIDVEIFALTIGATCLSDPNVMYDGSQ